MLHPHALIKLFGYNAELITKQAASVAHEESLRVLPFAPQSFNWMLGHIISARTWPLNLVHAAPVWSDEQRAPYRFGSAADTKDALPLHDLLDAFSLSHERLVHGLNGASYDAMCQPSGYGENTLGDSLAYFQFHEAQHVGQLLYLANFLGKESVWIT